MPRSPSALVIIRTCGPGDIHALAGESGAKPALPGWSCLAVPVPARVNQGFAETGHPHLCVILSDAESGRDTWELRLAQLPAQLIARQATPAALTQDIVHLLVSSLSCRTPSAGGLSAADDARPAPRHPGNPRPSVQRAVNRWYISKALRST